MGQDVTGAISLGQNVVGQDVSGAGRRGAELRGAGRRWGKISGAGGHGAEGSGAGSGSPYILHAIQQNLVLNSVSTTGYGDLVPVTHIGKGMTMLFALTCIPLYYMMVMMYSRHGLAITRSLVEKCTSDTRRAFLV